jgi:formate/nitrite transporter FocA (FNT family)
MVCMAVLLYNVCTDSAGKIMAIWFPVVVFVISGYEHCVANSELELANLLFLLANLVLHVVFFLSVGLLYGAPSTIGQLWFNQSAALCGNVVGGAVVIGMTLHLMNNWISPIPWERQSDNNDDIEKH